jgi:hypothetical protein
VPTDRSHQPRLRAVNAVDTLEAGESECLRAHRAQDRIVERRKRLWTDEADQVDEPRDADAPRQLVVVQLLDAGRLQPAGDCTIRA